MKVLEKAMELLGEAREQWDRRYHRRVAAAAPLLDPSMSEKDVQQGFRRISSANTARDLSPLLQDRMIELAWYLYDRNPLAKRLINLTKIFVLGDGLKVQAKDPRVQEWLDGFWNDPVNRLDLELPSYVQELSIFGEQLYLTTENPIDGAVRLWYIDPSEIDQVVYGGAGADVPGADRSVAIPIEILLKQKLGEATAPRLEPFRRMKIPARPLSDARGGTASTSPSTKPNAGRADAAISSRKLTGWTLTSRCSSPAPTALIS